MTRPLFLILGLLFVGVGVIGVVVPLLPTTIFLIFAAGCFARSSPRLERWLMEHPRFGPLLSAWRRHGAIPPRAKALACAGIAFGYGVFLWKAHPALWAALLVAAILAAVASFILSRPSGPAT
jgi:uncharacterized protein